MLLLLLSQLFKRIIDKGAFNFVDSFLGGAAGFGSNVPSYGDVGSGYTGDFFGGSSSGGSGVGSSLLQGLGRGILGSLTGDSPRGDFSTSQRGPYANQAQNDMRNLLALAMRSFETPRSVI